MNAKSLIDLIDTNCGTNSTSYPTATKVVDINLAIDKAMSLISKADGRWQFDDSNHTADPIITFDLVEGQSDYHWTTDEQGNLILDAYRIMVADENGIFYDLTPTDQQLRGKAMEIVDGQAINGKPNRYDKTGKGAFLVPAPDYSYTKGVKMFINRESSYFTALDTFYTTKKPGFDGRLHEYLATRPTFYYAGRKGFKNINFWRDELLKFEGDEDRGITGLIESIYSKRNKDEKTQIIPKYRSSR